MYILRKTVLIQTIMFFAFFLMAGYLILDYYLGASTPWIFYILLGLFAALLVLGIYVYRSNDSKTVVITQPEYKRIRTVLYTYFGLYVLQMILSTVGGVNPEIVALVSGSLLMAVALFGLFLQYSLLRVKSTKQ